MALCIVKTDNIDIAKIFFLISDEFHPLCDDEDVSIQKRNNSAVHIKIARNSAYDIDIAYSL